MSNGQCALVREAIEIPKFNYVEEKKDELRGVDIRHTLFFGSEFTASHTVTAPVRVTPDGPDEVRPCHHDIDFYPPGDRPLGGPKRQILWSLGRGFSKEIREIAKAFEQSDGTILCTGISLGPPARSTGRWELVIDPGAGYMVRSAKFFREGEDAPSVEVSNSGLKRFDACCIPEKSIIWFSFIRGEISYEIPMTFESAALEADLDFFKSAEKSMHPPYEEPTYISDQRVSPPFLDLIIPGKSRIDKPAADTVKDIMSEVEVSAASPPGTAPVPTSREPLPKEPEPEGLGQFPAVTQPSGSRSGLLVRRMAIFLPLLLVTVALGYLWIRLLVRKRRG